MPTESKGDSTSIAPRMIVLTGAPYSSELKDDGDTSSADGIERRILDGPIKVFEPKIIHFLQRCRKDLELLPEVLSGYQREKKPVTPKCSYDLPTWRLLRKPSHHLRSGISQSNWLRPSTPQVTTPSRVPDAAHKSQRDGSHVAKGMAGTDMSFLTETSEVSSQSFHSSIIAGVEDDNADERLSDYLDESFALFEDSTDVLSSSVIEPPSSSRSESRPKPTESEQPWPYTSLAEVPHHSKIPSSSRVGGGKAPLISVVAVVISVTGPREVTIRRTGRKAQLYELLVGDETASGFGVTIWQSGAMQKADEGYQKPRQQANKGLRVDFADSPGELKRGTVVELLNIALTKFQERVYGQSQGTFRKADPMRTQIYQLNARNGIHSREMSATEKRMNKQLRAVRSWWRDFAALDADKDCLSGNGNGKRKVNHTDEHDEFDKTTKQPRWLPPDESMIDE